MSGSNYYSSRAGAPAYGDAFWFFKFGPLQPFAQKSPGAPFTLTAVIESLSRIVWARTSQFNWVYDNKGGSPTYEAVCGALSGCTGTVAADGKVYLQTPMPGGGKTAYIRGVWKTGTVFPYNGFWANPETGDLTNYYTGGSYLNQGSQTIITLGTGLAAGTPVQIYYFYNLDTPLAKGEAANNYPCPRKAYRGPTDFTYDFAVDRMLDLMGVLHGAGQIRNQDYSQHWRFLWQKLYPHSVSLVSPLMKDDFERSFWDKGPFLLYKNSSLEQAGFATFETQLYPGDDANPPLSLSEPRMLRVVLPPFSTSAFAAWWGYGLNWDLSASPFNGIDRLKFKFRSACNASSIFNISKTSSGGNAVLVVKDQSAVSHHWKILIQIQNGGAIGAATYRWSKDGGQTWEASGLLTCDKDHQTHLIDDIYLWWEHHPLDWTPDFVSGDYWTFRSHEFTHYPQRLLIALNDAALGNPDPWTETHTFYHGLPDRYEELTQLEIPFTQFWRRDNVVYDGDRRRVGWQSWYSAGAVDSTDIVITEREATETIYNEIFHTQMKIETFLTAAVTGWGVWTGLNTSEVNSIGRTGVNLAIKPEISGWSAVNMRLKVKDANDSYFYKDFTVQVGIWNRLSTTFAGMILDWGSYPLTHPVKVVDIGIAASPPLHAVFYVTDVKFDNHIPFAGPNLRVLEFKFLDSSLALEPPAYWFDDITLNLEAEDPYPYVPRLALSLGPHGLNPWRGPTLVHYAHPLAPHLMDLSAVKSTYVQFHQDAQDAYNKAYGGTKGPILPVHTRNDIENISLLGCANFNKFCWWPDYPETGSGLGQYWAFMRLAHFYSVTGSTSAWAVLDNWLTWINQYGAADGPGWKFPALFSSSGFSYGSYDPGQTAAIAIGCLYIYMRNQDSRADTWVRRILDDLRTNRQSPTYQYLYKTDFHYGWLNALVAHAFGLAVTGRPWSSYTFSTISEDHTHFHNMINQFFAMSGDSKPNVLNADLLPFSLVENADNWSQAPNYMMNKEYGSTEALVLMMEAALDYAAHTGDWAWFDKLLKFVLLDNLTTMAASSIESITASLDTSLLTNKIRVLFGDFMRDKAYYKEAEDSGLIDLRGEIPREIDLRYGNPVITEDYQTAQLLADRALAYFSKPVEHLEVDAWLEALRIKVGETVAVSSDFHGYDKDEFFCYSKLINLQRRRVTLNMIRQKERN